MNLRVPKPPGHRHILVCGHQMLTSPTRWGFQYPQNNSKFYGMKKKSTTQQNKILGIIFSRLSQNDELNQVPKAHPSEHRWSELIQWEAILRTQLWGLCPGHSPPPSLLFLPQDQEGRFRRKNTCQQNFPWGGKRSGKETQKQRARQGTKCQETQKF